MAIGARNVVVLLIGMLASAAAAETITVAVAVSLKDAVNEIAKTYKADTGEDVRFTFGSSGQLAAQVRNGAPVDAFVSAANAQVDDLEKDGLIEAKTRRVVAGNALVLIVPAAATAPPADFAALADARFKRVAIGEPKTVPAGQYAMQALRAMKLDGKLGDRAVYGANVRQVLDYVRRGEVDAGIVYLTDAREAGERVRVVATADPATHEPVVYPGVVVAASKKRDAAARFLDYLGTERARRVLDAKGFAAGGAAEKKSEK